MRITGKIISALLESSKIVVPKLPSADEWELLGTPNRNAYAAVSINIAIAELYKTAVAENWPLDEALWAKIEAILPSVASEFKHKIGITDTEPRGVMDQWWASNYKPVLCADLVFCKEWLESHGYKITTDGATFVRGVTTSGWKNDIQAAINKYKGGIVDLSSMVSSGAPASENEKIRKDYADLDSLLQARQERAKPALPYDPFDL